MNRPWAEEFFVAVKEKMVLGQQEHGDASLDKMPSALVSEMMEECVDIAGWGAIAWMRLKKLRAAIIDAEDLVSIPVYVGAYVEDAKKDDAQRHIRTEITWEKE